MSAHKDLLTISDLTQHLQKSGIHATYPTVHRRVMNGDIPASRLGFVWCIEASDLPAIRDFFRTRPCFAKHNVLAAHA